MSNWRVSLAIGFSFVIILAVGLVVGGSKAATAIPFPAVSPVVCATAGVCFEVDNTGKGVAVEGQALKKGGVGLFGLAPSTTLSGTGVLGQAFGSSSIGIKGVSFSTDASHVSVGVSGVSANGPGVKGTTTFNSAQLLTAAAGVLGNDKSTAFGFDMGVEGTSTLGVGVAGISQNGNALTGSSSNANGVVGQTTFFPTSSQGQAGVLGRDLATPGPLGTPQANAGVEGTSLYGSGVIGTSGSSVEDVGAGVFGQSTSSGTGVMGKSMSGVGVSAYSNAKFVAALTAQSKGYGIAVVGFEGGILAGVQPMDGVTPPPDAYAIAGVNNYGPGVEGSGNPAIFALGNGTGVALLAQSAGPTIIVAATFNTNVMSLDSSGNMILAGNLTQNGTPLVAHRSPGGAGVGTYSAQQTTKTIEDLGEGQLVNGQSYVRLDPDYSSLTNTHKTYLVFLTPQGDCRGLYVTLKSPAGFAVQEMNGGRSTVAFDYRIVAQSLESSGSRLPKIPPISNQQFHLPVPPSPHVGFAAKPLTRLVPSVRPGYVPSGRP